MTTKREHLIAELRCLVRGHPVNHPSGPGLTPLLMRCLDELNQEAGEEWPERCPRCGNNGDNDRCGGFAWTYSATMRRVVCKLCDWPVPSEVALGRILSAEGRLARISQIIEHVDNRCMAADGPVTQTLQEMTQAEMSEIYALASGTPGGRMK